MSVEGFGAFDVESINQFRGEYAFLSNFWMSPLVLNGMAYSSVEHAFQAQKTLDKQAAEQIRLASTCREAKQLGRMAMLRPDWEEVKLSIMEACLKAKFSDVILREKLLATGDAMLVEGNNWCDTYWGVCRCVAHKGKGENNLGQALVRLRQTLRSQ